MQKEEEEEISSGGKRVCTQFNADSGVSRNKKRLWLIGITDIFPLLSKLLFKSWSTSFTVKEEFERTYVWDLQAIIIGICIQICVGLAKTKMFC